MAVLLHFQICRFCAQPKEPVNILNLEDESKRGIISDIFLKLNCLNICLNETNSEAALPKSICALCFTDLNKAWEFVEKYKRSQLTLTRIYNQVPFYDVSGKTITEGNQRVTLEHIIPLFPQSYSSCQAGLTVSPQHHQDSTTYSSNKNNTQHHNICKKNSNILTVSYEPIVPNQCISNESTPVPKNLNNETQFSNINKDTPTTSNITNSNSLIVKTEDNSCEPYDQNGILDEFETKDGLVVEALYEPLVNEPIIKLESQEDPIGHDIETVNAESSNIPQGNESANELQVFKDIENLDISIEQETISVREQTWIDYKWLCVFCDEEFPDMIVLREHAKSQHANCAAFTCSDCDDGAEYDKFHSFVNHVRKHRKGLRNQCVYCDTKCDDVLSHSLTHITSPEKACDMCGEVLPSAEALIKHYKAYYTPRPSSPPPPPENPLIKSKRRKPGTPITTEELTCNICQKVTKSLDSLRSHKYSHREKIREHTCEKCGKAYYNKYYLSAHMKTHGAPRPFVCNICDKSFFLQCRLKRHMRTHLQAKPFSCDHCGKSFRDKCKLREHMILHSSVKPHKCSYCNKGFNYKNTLEIHLRQHTGARPYSCDDCGMDFANWSNCNKHVKRRHGKTLSKKVRISNEMLVNCQESIQKFLETGIQEKPKSPENKESQ